MKNNKTTRKGFLKSLLVGIPVAALTLKEVSEIKVEEEIISHPLENVPCGTYGVEEIEVTALCDAVSKYRAGKVVRISN